MDSQNEEWIFGIPDFIALMAMAGCIINWYFDTWTMSLVKLSGVGISLHPYLLNIETVWDCIEVVNVFFPDLTFSKAILKIVASCWLRQSTKLSTKTLFGSCPFDGRRITGRQGNAILIGRIPLTRYEWDMIVPITGHIDVSMWGSTAGKSNKPPSKSLHNILCFFKKSWKHAPRHTTKVKGFLVLVFYPKWVFIQNLESTKLYNMTMLSNMFTLSTIWRIHGSTSGMSYSLSVLIQLLWYNIIGTQINVCINLIHLTMQKLGSVYALGNTICCILYRIAGNFGGELNLAVYLRNCQIKIGQYFILACDCMK